MMSYCYLYLLSAWDGVWLARPKVLALVVGLFCFWLLTLASSHRIACSVRCIRDMSMRFRGWRFAGCKRGSLHCICSKIEAPNG